MPGWSIKISTFLREDLFEINWEVWKASLVQRPLIKYSGYMYRPKYQIYPCSRELFGQSNFKTDPKYSGERIRVHAIKVWIIYQETYTSGQ